MKRRSTILIGSFLMSCILGYARVPDSTATIADEEVSTGIYNIGDHIFEYSNCIYLPYDDWGVKGNIQVFGLPVSALSVRSGGLQISDPVYGQVPLTWLNPRFDEINYNPTSLSATLRAFSPKTKSFRDSIITGVITDTRISAC
jgi:hypothetical protein